MIVVFFAPLGMDVRAGQTIMTNTVFYLDMELSLIMVDKHAPIQPITGILEMHVSSKFSVIFN